MYPQLLVDLDKIYQNAARIVELCRQSGIEVAGVVKGCSSLDDVVKVFVRAGCKWIADSRIERLTRIKKELDTIPLMLLRIPMKDEIPAVIAAADLSLNSEWETIEHLNREAERQGREHGVILMVELGDLREGIYPAEEVISLGREVEKLTNITLKGIGTNLSCYGGVVPDEKNLGQLVDLARKLEKSLNRKLEVISGGATTSLPLLLEGRIPEGINNLRIGEAILLARDMGALWDHHIPQTYQDTFVLQARIVEMKEKPSVPRGTIYVDAFGRKPVFPDRGMRKRAIAAVGKADFVYPDQLVPRQEGIEILGASSDHLLLDVTEAGDIKLGDVVEFELFYGPLLHLTQSKSVKIVYK